MCFFSSPTPPKAPEPPPPPTDPAEVSHKGGTNNSDELDRASRASGVRSGFGTLVIPTASGAVVPPANAVNLPR